VSPNNKPRLWFKQVNTLSDHTLSISGLRQKHPAPT